MTPMLSCWVRCDWNLRRRAWRGYRTRLGCRASPGRRVRPKRQVCRDFAHQPRDESARGRYYQRPTHHHPGCDIGGRCGRGGDRTVAAGRDGCRYGVPHGQEYWQFGAIHMTDGSIGLALAVAVRVIALGLPAIVLFSTIDPTALADGLAQRLHAPARFVIAALAADRLTTLVVNDWQNMALSRRARGLSDVAPVRRFVSMAFGLLVLSIRRGSKLATAMEARGFGTNTARTWARPSPVGWWDAALIGVALAIAVSAIVVSILTGSFRVVWL